MKLFVITFICLACSLGGHVNAQGVALDKQEYQELKRSGKLPANVHPMREAKEPATMKPGAQGSAKGGGGVSPCDCWIEPDATYTLAMLPNDDGSSAPINIPFQFDLYNDLFSLLYINNNGNVSFDSPWATFTATSFPTASFAMVAPFWGDVDTRGDDGFGLNGGEVWYKITPSALYVNWVEVGYFNSYTDKHNTFQLIITDGNDPVIGIGKNVGFCYKEMEWTTGDASGGTNGFGGSPATVGANRGNGVDFIQFGTFDQPGGAYDGPFGMADGIDWLDNKNFIFTTSVSTQNIPPIASSQFLCDTITVCVGEQVQFDISFIAPELNQTVVATSQALTLSNYTELVNTSPNITADITGQFIPQPGEVGFHIIELSATDDGAPPLTTTVNIVVEVVPAPSAPPVISGDTALCNGELTTLAATGPYTDFSWSNNTNGPTTEAGPGTYTVVGLGSSCPLTSEPFIVSAYPDPDPVITGPSAVCDGEPALLGTTLPYDTYLWSTTSTDPTIFATTGNYTVTVTNEFGCVGTSAPFNVVVGNNPTAMFIADPPSPQPPGASVDFTNTSLGNGSQLAGQNWSIAGTPFTTTNTSWTFPDPGVYSVSLIVTTVEGCQDTIVQFYTILPGEIFIPNVFSPNGDGMNDNLEFTGVEFYPNSDLKVFNRWGGVVYESASYRNQWKPGREVPEGTYFYILSVSNGETYSGHVTLVR